MSLSNNWYHGLIGAEDGRKMSKSLGNVVDPLDVIDQGMVPTLSEYFVCFSGQSTKTRAGVVGESPGSIDFSIVLGH